MTKPIRAIGFLAGLAGDLVISSPAIREFKQVFPNSHLTFAIGSRYAHMAELFRGLPYIDDFHIWETYDNWPTQGDKDYLAAANYDFVFNPFPHHTRSDWYNLFHYTQETSMMQGLPCPVDCQCELGYVPEKRDCSNVVTLSLFASGSQLSKTLTEEQREELAAKIRERGLIPVQIGSNDLRIKGCEWGGDRSITQATDLLVNSHCHITIDTSFAWIASAYKKRTIGLYGVNYADMRLDRIVSHNPVNPNATYLNRQKVSDINVDEIINLL